MYLLIRRLIRWYKSRSAPQPATPQRPPPVEPATPPVAKTGALAEKA
jgi:hypothetical protein